MKIAMVVWDLSVSGGTQRQAMEFADYLRRNGHEVRFYCAYVDRSKCYPRLMGRFEVKSLHEAEYAKSRNDVLTWVLHPLEPLIARQERRLERLMDDGFDVVNCHDQRAYRVAVMHKKRCGTPVVWMMNDLPKSLWPPKRRPGARGLFDHVHFYVFGGPVAQFVDVQRVRRIDRVASLDKGTAKTYGLVSGRESTVVRSGLDAASFKFTPRQPRSGGSNPKILAVGIFFPHRRFEDLVNAVSLLHKKGMKVSLSILGSESYDPKYAARIRSLTTSLGLGDIVSFSGTVSDDELRNSYAEADVFVFPNSPQTWGLAVFEAMASGTPVIVSTGAGASEILTDGENALLVSPGRPEEIAVKLERLLTDDGLYSRLSVNGRDFVERELSWDRYGENMMKFFDEVTAKSSQEDGVRDRA